MKAYTKDTNVIRENMMNTQKRNHNKEMKVDNAKVDNASLRNMLSRETISKYFYMPITRAAKELNIGLTMLKKRCRDLGIRRWPRRKLMSLQTLIDNVQQELGKNSGYQADEKKRESIMILEQEKKKREAIMIL
ncbi:RKD1-like protein [Tanacetum coccineum]